MTARTDESETKISGLVAGGELVIARVLDAPRAVVYRAWTEPEQFAEWFGPRGSRIPFCRLDVRPGGDLHFCHDHGEEQVWVRGEYEEVEEPRRLVFKVHFSDEWGARRDRPGFPPEMRITVELEERGAGTEVTIRQSGLERDQGEVQGWREAMDRLAERVSSG